MNVRVRLNLLENRLVLEAPGQSALIVPLMVNRMRIVDSAHGARYWDGRGNLVVRRDGDAFVIECGHIHERVTGFSFHPQTACVIARRVGVLIHLHLSVPLACPPQPTRTIQEPLLSNREIVLYV